MQRMLWVCLSVAIVLSQSLAATAQAQIIPVLGDEGQWLRDDPDMQLGHHPHPVPMRDPNHAPTPAQTTPPHVVYYGGPVLPAVKVYTLFWGGTTRYMQQLDQFYRDITASAYLAWMREYSTPAQVIGNGMYIQGWYLQQPPGGAVVDDVAVQKELASLMRRGIVPSNDGNSLIMVHFPPGITITMSDGASCQNYCGYHGTFMYDNVMQYYGVIPDHGGGCTQGCGSGLPDQLQRTTITASHEVIEAVTDPGVGMAHSNGPPLGWYDDAHGEVADICLGQADVVGAWHVQKVWSNQYQVCRAQ